MSKDKSLTEAVDALTESGFEVTLGDGTEVQIFKCKVKHIAKLTQFGELLFSELGINDFDSVQSKTANLFDPAFIMGMLSRHTDEFVGLLAVFCDLSTEALEELDLDDALAVATKAYEVNKDFLMKKVMPILAKNPAP